MRRFHLLVGVMMVVVLGWSGLVLAAVMVQDFDNPGTGYALEAGWAPAQVLGGGPSGNFIRLNYADTYNNSNFIAFDRTQEAALKTVVAHFDFRMFAGSRANGFGFALLNTANYGTTGVASWSLGEEPNCAGSLGIGFDLLNGHLSVHFNGLTLKNFVAYNLYSFLEEPNFSHALIRVELMNRNITVGLRTPYSTEYRYYIENFFVPGLAPYDARVAFGARTGTRTANHDLDNINVVFAAPMPLPASLLLFGSGLLGLLPLVRRKN